jgi:lipase maturation factor
MAAEIAPSLRSRWFAEAARDVQLTRFMLLRGLGFIYLVGFLIVIGQGLPLLGERGLLPIGVFLSRLRESGASASVAFWAAPSLFWLSSSDAMFQALAWLGGALSLGVLLGLDSAVVMLALWAIYGSFVHVGQIFYGYGWEMLLLEAGFLGVFLAPLRPRLAWVAPGQARSVPPLVAIWLYRWLLLRVMLGAGLIKLRGDDCWRDLTCLVYHYETQPNPHPLSWLWHQLPPWWHAIGVLANHAAELVVPFGVFGPRRLRHIAGACTVLFQTALILSGNLSFLNWLTIVVALACFDDSLWSRLLPGQLVAAVADANAAPLGRAARGVSLALALLIGVLSLEPTLNLLGPDQRMNAGFDPLHLVNTYGAFGSISRERNEIVLEGALGPADAREEELAWKELELPCKPVDPERAPCWITPYHYRLDWQMWFAAMGRPERQIWLLSFVHQLLTGSAGARSLLSHDPFEGVAPTWVRASYYRYELTGFGEPGWWRRTRLGSYLPALRRDDPRLLGALERFGLADR